MSLKLIFVATSRGLLLWGDFMRVKIQEFVSPFPSVHEVESVDFSRSPSFSGLFRFFSSDGNKFVVSCVPESQFSPILDSLLVNGFADLSAFPAQFVPLDCDEL